MELRQALLAVVCVLAVPVAVAAAEPEGSWQATTPDWDLREAGPGGRSIVIVYPYGGCVNTRNLHTEVRETARSVVIRLSGEEYLRPPGSPVLPCPPSGTQPLSVSLAEPLAGRRIRGLPADVLSGGSVGIEREQSVPRLVGLSPIDAEHALRRVGLKAAQGRLRRSRGLTRVVSQRPAAGAPLREGAAVVLGFAGRRSGLPGLSSG